MASTLKTSKSRSDTAVQGTNDSSIVSKCSAARQGYFKDDFLKYLVAKEVRRSPLINRGYYIRALVMKHTFSTFMKLYGNSPNQIVSLGAGFDSSYFRLKSEGLLTNTVYIEVDFPDVMQRKRRLIDHHDSLRLFLTDITPGNDSIILNSLDYKMLGVDLTQLSHLTDVMKSLGLKFDLPTILISEVVLTYMSPKFADKVIQWASQLFTNSIFIQYEQVCPTDAFGIVMKNHFLKIGSPLKCIDKYPTQEDQERRFLNLGWSCCRAVDLNEFNYQLVSFTECERVQKLEPFDEYEEWHLKCSHYTFVTATRGCCCALLEDLHYHRPQSCEEILDLDIVSENCDWGATCSSVGINERKYPEIELKVFDVNNVFSIFGHSATLLTEDLVLILGGFGEVDGKHGRLKDFYLYDLNSRTSTRHEVDSSIASASLDKITEFLFHTATVLKDGRVVIFGGRTSPMKPSDKVLIVQVPQTKSTETESKIEETLKSKIIHDFTLLPKCGPSLSDMSESTFLEYTSHTNAAAEGSRSAMSDCSQVHCREMSICGDGPCPRWRHGAVCIDVKGGSDCLLVYGGCSSGIAAFDDCYLLDTDTWTWSKVTPAGDIPGGRHSHSLVMYGRNVLMSGGLDKKCVPTNAIHSLNTDTWEWIQLNVRGNLLPRYSHTSCIIKQSLVLIGGVNLEAPPPGVAVIHLPSLHCQEYHISATVGNDVVMLHNHASIKLSDSSIVVLGGGGNCFSFGTHLNSRALILELKGVLDFYDQEGQHVEETNSESKAQCC